jgi:hypothetical protein
MTEIDLRALSASDVVLHFGGRPNEVDAFTFSNALIAFSDALRELNHQINDNFSIEITIEGIGPGSFRAKIGTKLKSLGGLFASDAKALLIGILGTFIYVRILDPQQPPTIIINDDSVIVVTGTDRAIVPRTAWEAKARLKKPEAVAKSIAKAFEVMEDDPSISDFGLAAGMQSYEPVGIIQRSEFAILARPIEPELDDDDSSHVSDERAKITVLKLIFERGGRRWQFVWTGIRISAPIKDDEFFTKMESREYVFRQGDILDVTLRIFQIRDPMSRAFINDHYEIIKVHGLESAPNQQVLI